MGENSSALVRDAETLDRQLRFIRHYLRQSFAADERVAKLTAPQTNVMSILAKTHQKEGSGLTIRELCTEIGLSQSTVSGIVERLERKGLVSRRVNSADRRQNLVRIAEPVKEYLESDLRDRQLKPLLDILRGASREQKRLILEGVAALHGLLQAQSRRSAEAPGRPVRPFPPDAGPAQR